MQSVHDSQFELDAGTGVVELDAGTGVLEFADPQLLEAASKQLAGYTHFPLPSHAEFGIPLTF